MPVAPSFPSGVQPTVSEVQQPNDPTESYNNFQWARARFDKIIDCWKSIEDETERQRLLRYIKADKATLERLSKFKADETYLPIRLADQNIRAEQPQRIAYILQPRRAVVLKPYGGVNPVAGVEKLEMVFTDYFRYLGWERPFLRVDDGASGLGWDTIEIVFDETKPGHFGFEHVGHENLLFDLEAEEINNQELVIRKLKVTAAQLRKYIRDFGFSKTEVDKLIETNENNEQKTKDILYDIYKCFYRDNDSSAISVGYYGGPKTSDFLKKPAPFYLGIHDLTSPQPIIDPLTGQQVGVEFPRVAETSYPFFPLYYVETEAPKIKDVHGRIFLDEPAQEAASAVLSGIVNGTMRASNVYAAVKPSAVPNTNNDPAKAQTTKLNTGVIYDQPLEFFSTPYPPESSINALNTITQYNKQDISRPDFAVKNRKDSRKTATEVAASVQDAAQAGSVQSTQQGIFMRGITTKSFEIFQNRALQGKIPVSEDLQPLLKYKYDVKSAGDVDVLQRAEKLNRFMTSWPVLSQTPAAMEVLKDYITLAFPEEAARYLVKLQEGEEAKALVMSLANLLKIAITDDQGQLEPEFQGQEAELGALTQQVQQFLLPAGQQEQTSNNEQPEQGSPIPA